MPTDELKTPWDVMVVDDEAGIRELLMSYFSGLGLGVTGAADGREAISLLQRSNGRFGLVVTDLNLPGADGFAVLQAAKHASSSCYVVIVTGYASMDSAIQAVRVGAYDYLVKPFLIGQLDAILRGITERTPPSREHRPPTHPPQVALPASQAPRGGSPQAAGTLEQRMTAMEAALARIEARLG